MRLIYVHQATVPERRARTIQVINTCWQIANLGIEVWLLVERLLFGSLAELLGYYGLGTCQRLEIKPVLSRGLHKALRALVSERRADDTVLFCRNLKTATLLIALARRLRLPVVYEAHKLAFMVVGDEARNAGLPAGQVHRKTLRTFRTEGRVVRAADAVICTTDATLRFMTSCFGALGNAVVVRNGGPEPAFAVRSGEEGGGQAPREVVYVGRLGGWKGGEALFDAMRSLEGFRLVVVGPDASGQKESLARLEPAVRKRILHLGFMEPGRVLDFLLSRRFSAAVIPLPVLHSVEAVFFTSPLKLFQYLAAGIPVVGSDVPALREVLRHRENALLVRPDDGLALADGIKEVASDRALALNLVENGVKTARSFSWANRAKSIAGVLEQVASEG